MGTLHRQLQYIDPQNIAFDKDNPRGLTEEQIVNDPNFKKLKYSIEEYGILEPVIIKKDESNQATYTLIDGERRLRAALAADQKEIPSLIAKDDTDGRILAYQVHMLRNNWDKAAETKAIKKLIGDQEHLRVRSLLLIFYFVTSLMRTRDKEHLRVRSLLLIFYFVVIVDEEMQGVLMQIAKCKMQNR